ncbi:MAG: hypothetical protein J6W06_08335 [Bacteroidales bacterium]|nr:hypothetical protein [Bacteroidales bacterium]
MVAFFDQHPSSFASPFTFSAKEKDSESGYTYFGARYYSDNIMMWLSVDPMSDKNASTSPYMYCAGNPIKYMDLYGMDTIMFNRYGYFGKPIPDNSDEDTYVRVSNKEFNANKIKYNKKGMLRNRHVCMNFTKGIIKNIDVFNNKNASCEIEGKKNCNEVQLLFEFLSDYTIYEWAHDIWKNKETEEYLNVLSTSHSEEEVNNKAPGSEYVPISLRHSHLPGGFYSSADANHYKTIMTDYNNGGSFNALIYKDGKYQRYDNKGAYEFLKRSEVRIIK